MCVHPQTWEVKVYERFHWTCWTWSPFPPQGNKKKVCMPVCVRACELVWEQHI